MALASSDEKSLIQASLDKARTAAAEQGITPEDQDTPAPSQMPTDIEEPSSPVYKDSKEGDVEVSPSYEFCSSYSAQLLRHHNV